MPRPQSILLIEPADDSHVRHAEYLQTSEFTALSGADITDAFVLLGDFRDVESLRLDSVSSTTR